jgi:hypothetical protein
MQSIAFTRFLLRVHGLGHSLAMAVAASSRCYFALCDLRILCRHSCLRLDWGDFYPILIRLHVVTCEVNFVWRTPTT